MKRLAFINRLTLVILTVLLLWGCATNSVEKPQVSQRPLLRVGMSPNSPPMAFKLNDAITGMEPDFAVLLGEVLNRDVMLVQLPFTDLINALLEGKIDIVMSGMTITKARQVRVSFTDPYLRIGQVAAMRIEDASKYNSLMNIRECERAVGVIVGTTGEEYVRANFPNASAVITMRNVSEAPDLLKFGQIDLFVFDAPAIVWLVSKNEARLRALWEPLDEEYLAWAVNRDDQTLLTAANAALATWKKNGTVSRLVNKWLPYWKISD
jgi:ABC-type amino acid transport substrate-binding protein